VKIAQDVAKLEVKAMSKFGDDLKKLGQTGVDGFISAFDNAVNKIREVGVKLHDKVIEGFNSKIKGFESAGSDAAKGFIKGLESQNSDASSAGKRLGEAVLNAARKALDSHSPSREFIKLGRDTDKGFAVGIDRYSRVVTDATDGVGHDAIRSMSSAIAGIVDVVDSNIDAAPTISPVLDLTRVTDGINQIDGSLAANRSMQLGVSANYQNGKTSQLDTLATTLNESNAHSNGLITSAMESIKGEIADLVGKVEQLKIVMDTGALVGAISPEMDRSLGGRVKLNRRGVL